MTAQYYAYIICGNATMNRVLSRLGVIRKPLWQPAIIAGGFIFLVLYSSSVYNYLLFHSIAEVFSIVVAFAIFIIIWNSRRFLDNNYFIAIGVAFFFIGGMDLVHTLAYSGMGVFPEYGANLATQLWISTRYLQSLSLLIAPFFIGRRIRTNTLLLAYALVVSLLLMSIFYWNIFPASFVEGSGLTPFKRISEYVISGILLASIFVMNRKRSEFDTGVLRLLFGAIIVTIASELSFTLYEDPFGLPNLIGHFLKIVSFYLIYKAIVETALVKPFDLLFRNLKHSEEQYHDLYEEAPSAYFSVGIDGRIKQANRRAIELFGYSREELIGRPIADLYADTPSGKAKAREVFEKFCTGEEIQDEELEMHRADGGKLWANLSVRPICDKEGQVIASRSWIIDITGKKQAEEEINRLAKFPSENPNPVMRIAQNGTILYANKSSSILLSEWKCKVGQLLPEHWHNLITEVLDTGLMKNTEVECKNRIFSLTLAPVAEKGYINVYGLDITERKQAEEGINKQKRLLEVTLESLTHPFYVVNVDNYAIEIANSAAGMSGKIENIKCYELTHKSNNPCSSTEHLCPLEEVKKTKKAVTVEHTHYDADGKKVDIEMHGFPVFDKKGKVTLMIAYYLDITERKQLDQLKDEFISLVSHELRSPLTVITGAVSTVMTEGSRLSEEETHQLLLDANQEADSLSRLLNNLLELSRAQAGRLIIRAEPVNLKKVLRDSIESIRRQSPAHRFILELPDKLPAVHADQLRLERILYNLLENAVKYSPDGGEIHVSVKLEKEHLVISISDQGIGISKIDKAKLFKPFQRIEDARLNSTRGLGLGLLVCQRLVESHGGQIWVESQPGRGSTFYFTLPLKTR